MTATYNDHLVKLFATLSEHAEDFVFDLSYDSIAGIWSVRINFTVPHTTTSVYLNPLYGHGNTLEEAIDDFCGFVTKAAALRAEQETTPNV